MHLSVVLHFIAILRRGEFWHYLVPADGGDVAKAADITVEVLQRSAAAAEG